MRATIWGAGFLRGLLLGILFTIVTSHAVAGSGWATVFWIVMFAFYGATCQIQFSQYKDEDKDNA